MHVRLLRQWQRPKSCREDEMVTVWILKLGRVGWVVYGRVTQLFAESKAYSSCMKSESLRERERGGDGKFNLPPYFPTDLDSLYPLPLAPKPSDKRYSWCWPAERPHPTHCSHPLTVTHTEDYFLYDLQPTTLVL